MSDINTQDIYLYQTKYLCPIHGEITDAWTSSVKGFEGNWCMYCWLEWLNKNVTKVDVIKKEEGD